MTEQETVPTQAETLARLGRYEYGWADTDTAGASARRGLNEEVVRDISAKKNEPQWMLDLRLKGLKLFDRKPMPTWGAELDTIEAAVLFPIGRRLDLEVNLGHGASDFFQAGMYGGLLLVVYGP